MATKVAQAAELAGESPQDYADRISGKIQGSLAEDRDN